MSSPSIQMEQGSLVGTGADLNFDALNFKPRRVELFNTDGDQAIWYEGMADDTMFKRVDSTGVGSVVATNGITPRAHGFSLGADADVNQSGKVVHFVAYGF
jgi:hypothetical protein